MTDSVRLLGIFLIILGIISLLIPSLISTAINVIVAIVFILAGIGQLSYSIKYKSKQQYMLISAVLLIIGGVSILFNPHFTALLVTILIIIFLITNGIFKIMLGLKSRQNLLISLGALSLLIGFYFIYKLTDAAFSMQMLGSILGFIFIFEGVSLLLLAGRVKKSL